MKKASLLVLLLINTAASFAQLDMHKNAIDTFLVNYNNNDFEKIYQSFSTKMQHAHSRTYYFEFFSRVKKGSGSLLSTELLDYRENVQNKSQARYTGIFENGNCTIKITMNGQNKIIGLYILKDKNFM